MSAENNDEDPGSDRSRSPMRVRQGLHREAVNNLERDDIDSDDELEESAVSDPSNSRWPFSVHRTEQSNAGTSAGNMRWWSFLGSPANVNLTAGNNASPRWRSATTSHQQNDQVESTNSNAAVQRQRTVTNESQRCFNSRISALFGRFLSTQSNSSSASTSTSTSASSNNTLVTNSAEQPHSSGYDSNSRLHASSSYLHMLQNDDEDGTQSALPNRQRTRVAARSNSSHLMASSNTSNSDRTELMMNRIVRNGPIRYQLAAQQQRIAVRMSQTGIGAFASAASDSGAGLSTQRRESIATNRYISPLSVARGSRPSIIESEHGSDEQERSAGPSSETHNAARTTPERDGSATPKSDVDTDDFQVRLRTAEQRFLHACEQVSLLNRQLERLQVRYEHACDRNQRAFRYTLRLRIAVVEGVRNMYYEYATQQTHEMTAIRCLVNSRSSRSSLQSIAL